MPAPPPPGNPKPYIAVLNILFNNSQRRSPSVCMMTALTVSGRPVSLPVWMADRFSTAERGCSYFILFVTLGNKKMSLPGWHSKTKLRGLLAVPPRLVPPAHSSQRIPLTQAPPTFLSTRCMIIDFRRTSFIKLVSPFVFACRNSMSTPASPS